MVPEAGAANVRSRSYKILAHVEIEIANASSVMFAHGSRFGGRPWFIKNGRVYDLYNFLGIKPEQGFKSAKRLKPAKYTSGMEFTRERAGDNGESIGATKLYVNESVVDEGPMISQ